MSSFNNSGPCKIHIKTLNGPITIRLFDHQLQQQASGAGELEAQVPAGLYMLEYRAGSVQREEYIRVEPDKPYENLALELRFPSAAPVAGTSTTHENHMYPAAELSRHPNQNFGAGGCLMIFVRTAGEGNPERVNVDRLSLWDAKQSLVGNLSDIVQRSDGEGWAGVCASVAPGGYALRYYETSDRRRSHGQSGHQAIDQSLWVTEGWITILFLTQDPRRQTIHRQSASIYMTRIGEGFVPANNPDAVGANQALELVLGGLRSGATVVPNDLLDLLLMAKFQNPMLGIVGAHALLQNREPDWPLFDTVVHNLELLVPGHPDVIALRSLGKLERRDQSSTSGPAVSWPPMLYPAYRGLIARDWIEHDLIRDASVAERAAARLLPQPPWSCWLSIEERTAERASGKPLTRSAQITSVVRQTADPGSGLDSALSWIVAAEPVAPESGPWAAGDLADPAVRQVASYLTGLQSFEPDLDLSDLSLESFSNIGLPVASVKRALEQLTRSTTRNPDPASATPAEISTQLLPLDQLGARERPDQPGVIDFGVLLPGITPADGILFVRIIHERDQFLQQVPAVERQLIPGQLANFGDWWSGSVDTNDPALKPSGTQGWGAQGSEQRYVYRYVLKRPNAPEIDGIIDPFAREYGVGDLSAITVGYQPYLLDEAVEQVFKVPGIKDAIIYELNVAELGGDLPKTIDLLDYIADLGVNVIEVMPVNNVASRIDWGYAPLGYLGVDERFGKRRDFQRFVVEAHRRGMAVVVDSVFGHVEDRFPYHRLYALLGKQSPFTGAYGEDLFFQSTDFAKPLTRSFFFTVCVHWLEKYHVDGFRYDAVSQYWDEARPAGQRGYADLAAAVLAHVLEQGATSSHHRRFFPAEGAETTLIQIAEYLTHKHPPEHVLFDTVANSAWQNQTMEAAKRCARGEPGALAELGFRLGLAGYPDSRMHDGALITKSALQYIESHDHERFICTFGTHFPDDDSRKRGEQLLLVGDRDQSWYKVQPYLIGLLTAKGTPFLWQGQEFCQNYFVPPAGIGRVAVYRPVDFNFFYDPIGRALIRLVRRLTRIRRQGRQFREGEHFFYNDTQYTHKGLLLFHRRLTELGKTTFSLVALNVTNDEQRALFRFAIGGSYQEQIEGQQNLINVAPGAEREITVPSNYGCIWTVQGL